MTNRRAFLTTGLIGTVGALLLPACSTNGMTPGADSPTSTGDASVTRNGNEVAITSRTGKLLFSARMTNDAAIFTNSKGVVSTLPVAAFAHSTSYTLKDGTKLSADHGMSTAIGVSGATALASVNDKNEVTLTVPSRNLSVKQLVATTRQGGIHPFSCASARLAFAGCCVAEAAAAATVETGVGIAILIAASMLTAAAAMDMNEACQ